MTVFRPISKEKEMELYLIKYINKMLKKELMSKTSFTHYSKLVMKKIEKKGAISS